MNYKICKELKDAGFPQKLKYGDWYYENLGEEKVPTMNVGAGIEFPMCAKIPTLDEIIEEIGEDFGELQRDDDGTGVVWYVSHRSIRGMIGEGKTPFEAVAKLYIKSKQKNDL